MTEWSPEDRWLRLTLHGCLIDQPFDWIRAHISVATEVVVDLRDRHVAHERALGPWAPGSYYLG